MFRPCIDLHEGKVKQIVGGTLDGAAVPRTNFVSDRSSVYYAELYGGTISRAVTSSCSAWETRPWPVTP